MNSKISNAFNINKRQFMFSGSKFILAGASLGSLLACGGGGSSTAASKKVLAGIVSTYAGLAGSFGNVDGVGSSARFSGPFAITTDASGNTYVACLDHTIRKITPAALVTTFAGATGVSGSVDGTGTSALFNSPRGITVDANGNLFVTEFLNNTIRKITPAGVVSTFAGLAGASGSFDGVGSAARFDHPSGITCDSSGNLYVADRGSLIRKISSTAVVTTIAGTPSVFGSTDGAGASALFSFVTAGLAIDAAGNLYLADTDNYTIRKISTSNIVSTIAGTTGVAGTADGVGTLASFTLPIGITIDSVGNLYVADQNVIRKITSSGVVSILAGTYSITGSSDGTGQSAQFTSLRGLSIDITGSMTASDTGSHTIRKIV